ncbi:hypothetical protein PoB_003519000 [Plakobranchus ocellatus]|uniref:Uncharacterized protein n=1 Tax=Plakobranchus ocellatus TaxID=259542 RepID=A0AAV4AP90_9GAST|nr:hypothetical protein PoB_003519000 [Plakobranchus ocellatus]
MKTQWPSWDHGQKTHWPSWDHGQIRRVGRWLVRPICAQKLFWQYGQGMEAVPRALAFPACLCCTAATIQLATWDFRLLWTAVRHPPLSVAVSFHQA